LVPFKYFLDGVPQDSPTTINVQAINNSVIHTMNIDTWKELEKKNPDMIEVRNQAIMRSIGTIVEHASNLATMDAKTHYKFLLKKYPWINDTKAEYVASYLGIDTTHLSKIKSEIKKKNT